MRKIPADRSYPCIFRITGNGPEKSWYEKGLINQCFRGLYCGHHSEDANIFLANQRFIEDEEFDCPECRWVYAKDAELITWTSPVDVPTEEYRNGLNGHS